MKDHIRHLRSFMAADLYKTRKSRKLSQARMAELLGIDLRSYSYLEHGENLCSTYVFILYLLRFKEDRDSFLAEIEQVFAKVKKEQEQAS